MPFQNNIGESSNCVCGLVFYLNQLNISSEDEAIPVPLKGVQISTKIVEFVSEIQVTQTYVNVESNPIEAVYMFPVEEEAAVISFEAQVENRKISTQIKEKEEARKDYDEAMQNRKTAVLLEETQPDIFQIKVGHLKPNEEAKITITYVSELPVEDGKIKLTIPTTIAPRYVPSSDSSEAAKQIASIPYSEKTPAPFSFNLIGLAQSKIKSIKSPSHEFKFKVDDVANQYGQFNYSGELSIQTSDMDRDIIIYIDSHNPEEQNKPIAFLEKPDEKSSNNGLVGMVSLIPNFELKEQLTELIFLVDRSGSMSGSSMNQAKKALELFLHSLPSDCYFNIWSFGSRYDALYPNGSIKYSDSSLNNALNHVRQMSANYGGTEIYSPLRDIFQQDGPGIGYLRQIFVLTDGEVSNAPSIISLVKQNNSQGRIFSLGIGSSASRYLVKGIARAGSGTAVFANQNEDLRVKVMNQLKNALQPAISNINISWNDSSLEKQATSNDGPEKKKNFFGEMKSKMKQGKSDTTKKNANGYLTTKQVPFNVPPIFDGTRLLAYYFYPPEANKPNQINIKADSPTGQLTIDIDIVEANTLHESGTVRKLAARKKIQELEESKNVDESLNFRNDNCEENETKSDIKNTIIKLGLENGLTSQYTSFIGIDHTTGDTLTETPMSTREIKNQLAYGFGGMRGSPMRFGSGMRPMPKMKCAGVRSISASSMCLRRPTTSSVVSGQASFMHGIDGNIARCRMASVSTLLESCDDSSSDDDNFAESCVSNFSSKSLEKVKCEATAGTKDRMTELINLQKSNGMFDVSREHWAGSVLEQYLGSYTDVKSNCPSGIEIYLWITALSMKILEIKMEDKKELWDLIARKSQKFLNLEMQKENRNCQELMDQAEKYVKSK